MPIFHVNIWGITFPQVYSVYGDLYLFILKFWTIYVLVENLKGSIHYLAGNLVLAVILPVDLWKRFS